MFIISIFIIWVFYLFNGFLEIPILKSNTLSILNNPFLSYLKLIFPPQYLGALDTQLYEFQSLWPTFFMGEFFENVPWYFYIVTFLIKSPLPFVILLFFSLITFYSLKKDNYFHDILFYFILPVTLFFIYAIFFMKRPLGVRFLIPIIPFLSIIMANYIKGVIFSKKIYKKFVIIPLLLWYMIIPFKIYPHFLSYFNELVGGSKNGYLCLLDSDLDWDQDIKGLANFIRERKIEKIKLSHFGIIPPEIYGINYENLDCTPTSGIIAISANHLQGYNPFHGKARCYTWLKKFTPFHKIGNTIFIYDISSPPLPER